MRFLRHPAPENMILVGLWERFWAVCVDGLVLSGLDWCISVLFRLPGWPDAYRPWSAILFLVYFTLFEASPWQATPGKRLCGFHVATLDGKRLPWWRTQHRNVLRIVSVLPLFTGYLAVWLTPRRQALHDLLTGSVHVLGVPNAYELARSLLQSRGNRIA